MLGMEDTPLLPAETPPATEPSPEGSPKQNRGMIGAAIGVTVVVLLIISALVYLGFFAQPETTARVRDVFIILLALESFMIGLVLVILIVQLARLINLVQNEVKPILDSTNQTVSTLKGTTEFLSNNLVEPVIKINEFIAAFKQLGELLGIGRKN
jgi:hypothetical protein